MALVIFLYIIAANLVVYLLRLNYFTYSLLVYGVPSIFMLLRYKNMFLRVFTYVISVSTIIVFMDNRAMEDNIWLVKTMFPFLIQSVPLEDLAWGLLILCFIVCYYQLLTGKQTISIGYSLKEYATYSLAILLSVLTPLLLLYYHLLIIPYFYFWFGIFVILVFLPLLWFRTATTKVILKMLPLFSFLFFLNEVVGLQLGYWTFTGNQVIAWVSLFGNKLPIEELLVYILFFPLLAMADFDLMAFMKIKSRDARKARIGKRK